MPRARIKRSRAAASSSSSSSPSPAAAAPSQTSSPPARPSASFALPPCGPAFAGSAAFAGFAMVRTRATSARADALVPASVSAVGASSCARKCVSRGCVILRSASPNTQRWPLHTPDRPWPLHAPDRPWPLHTPGRPWPPHTPGRPWPLQPHPGPLSWSYQFYSERTPSNYPQTAITLEWLQ
eukprot:359710-Chlamydomonas_euryale.AAC.9